MNLMKITDWQGRERKFQFLGWRDDSRTTAFVFDEEAKRRAIDFHLPGRLEITFPRPPFSSSSLVELREVALCLPPCFASLEAANAFRKNAFNECLAAEAMQPWQLVSREVLALEPRHDRILSRALARFRRQQQEARAKRLAELEAWAKANHPSQDELAAARRRVEDLFTVAIPHRDTAEPEEKAPKELSLQHVRLGHGGLREQVLHTEWLKKHRLTAASVEAEQRAFRCWLQQAAVNRSASVIEAGTRTLRRFPVLRLSEDEWLVLAAAIRWRAHLQDGSDVWLDGLEERDLNSPEEITAFKSLEAGLGSAAPVTIEAACEAMGGIKRDSLRKSCKRYGLPYPLRTLGNLDRLMQARERGIRARSEKLAASNKKRARARLRSFR